MFFPMSILICLCTDIIKVYNFVSINQTVWIQSIAIKIQYLKLKSETKRLEFVY